MLAVALGAATALILTGCGSTSSSADNANAASTTHTAAGSLTPSQAALYSAMEHLWSQHMEWTYATIAAFKGNQAALPATLDRLTANQTDIGNAIKPIYGDAAGNQLTALLKEHIDDYVPVLKAAAAGDKAGTDAAFAKVLANGVAIGKFLEGANPNWAAPSIENMMNEHNQQTLAYAAAQLQGDYAKSIQLYGAAEQHMWEMGDMLAAGIIKQFPDKFTN